MGLPSRGAARRNSLPRRFRDFLLKGLPSHNSKKATTDRNPNGALPWRAALHRVLGRPEASEPRERDSPPGPPPDTGLLLSRSETRLSLD